MKRVFIFSLLFCLLVVAFGLALTPISISLVNEAQASNEAADEGSPAREAVSNLLNSFSRYIMPVSAALLMALAIGDQLRIWQALSFSVGIPLLYSIGYNILPWGQYSLTSAPEYLLNHTPITLMPVLPVILSMAALIYFLRHRYILGLLSALWSFGYLVIWPVAIAQMPTDEGMRAHALNILVLYGLVLIIIFIILDLTSKRFKVKSPKPQ